MPRPLSLALLALLLPLCTTAASVPREEYEVEPPSLEGTWRVIAITSNGARAAVSQDLIWHLRVTQNRVCLTGKTGGGNKVGGFYRIDPGRHPAHIDVLADGTPKARSVSQGIYRLDGNKLTICWGWHGSRPKAFVCKPWTTALVELVRVK